MKKLPAHWQGLLWSKNIKKISIEKDKALIIHHVLAYGDIPDIDYLRTLYSLDRIKKIFLERPIKIYTPAALNFVKNILLDMKDTEIDEKKYLKSAPRSLTA